MNILFVSTLKSVLDLTYGLKNLGHTVTALTDSPLNPDNFTPNPYFDVIESHLQSGTYDAAITYLYVPLLSDLCQKYHIPYISWVYDSPQAALFHPSIYNDCNHIFIFDYAQYDRLKAFHPPHIYHLPLAASVVRADNIVTTPLDYKRYYSEISFVGTLYEDNMYNTIHDYLPDYLLAPINNYLMHGLCDWTQPRKWAPLPSAVTDYMFDHLGFDRSFYERYSMPPELYMGLLLFTRKQAEMERLTVLNALAEDHPVDLYTKSTSAFIDALHVHGPVEYYLELGHVYRSSRINLNITLPSIETGVPQRVFDVLAYGGFLMSNAQEEIPDFFEVGKDLVVFHDLNEAKELADYYLTHEKERQEIAAHGYRTVKENYSYEKVLQEALTLCRLQ